MSERVREEMVEALAMMLYTADRPSHLGDLAALVGVRFTIADQYQSARRIAAALAASPASAKPVAESASGLPAELGDAVADEMEKRYRANLFWLEQNRHSLLVTADGRWWVPDFAPAATPYEAIENARLDRSMRTTPPAAAQDRKRLERMAVYVGHGKRTRDGMCGRCFDHGLATGFVCAWHDAMDVLHEMAHREDAARAAGATDGK